MTEQFRFVRQFVRQLRLKSSASSDNCFFYGVPLILKSSASSETILRQLRLNSSGLVRQCFGGFGGSIETGFRFVMHMFWAAVIEESESSDAIADGCCWRVATSSDTLF